MFYVSLFAAFTTLSYIIGKAEANAAPGDYYLEGIGYRE
jgi:hypothetical protein